MGKISVDIKANYGSLQLLYFRLLLEELVIYIEHCPKASFALQWKNFVHKCPFPLNEAFKPKSWKQIYNMNSVNASLSRIQMVGYNEKIVSIICPIP